MLYPVAILPGDDDSCAFGVEVPDIPGCFSAGKDADEALSMAREAIESHLEILAELGEPVPTAKSLQFYIRNEDYKGYSFAVIDVDVSKFMGKTEKINITLPGFLIKRIDNYVEKNPAQKSRSNFLAQAAIKLLQTNN